MTKSVWKGPFQRSHIKKGNTPHKHGRASLHCDRKTLTEQTAQVIVRYFQLSAQRSLAAGRLKAISCLQSLLCQFPAVMVRTGLAV